DVRRRGLLPHRASHRCTSFRKPCPSLIVVTSRQPSEVGGTCATKSGAKLFLEGRSALAEQCRAPQNRARGHLLGSANRSLLRRTAQTPSRSLTPRSQSRDGNHQSAGWRD